jgi:fatty-acyl-CoA synthase
MSENCEFWGKIISGWRSQPERVLLTFEGDAHSLAYTGDDLLALLPRIAAELRARSELGCQTFVIADDPKHQWLIFLGALWAGLSPGILTPPTPKLDPARYAEELRQTRKVFPSAQFCLSQSVMDRLPTDVADAQNIAIDGLLDGLERRGNGNLSPAVEVRFFQQSSGTTGLRKGMFIDQWPLLHQLEIYSAAIKMQPSDVVISWLPLYHDMGLVAAAIGSLWHGVPFVCTSPFAWLAHPRWLVDAVRRHKGTLCWLPNFAFEVMARRARESWELGHHDLTSLRMVINCSEPVSADTMERFAARFAPAGLDAKALSSCYAMAENVFAVTQLAPWRQLNAKRIQVVVENGLQMARDVSQGEGRAIAGSGTALSGIRIRINGTEDPVERLVGAIEIAGPTLVSGYVGTEQVRAIAPDGWYDTGDQGFILDGELFVLGRRDDMIIRAGQTIDPAGIEAAASQVSGVLPGRAVACGVDSPGEGSQMVILIAESNCPDGAALAAVRTKILSRVARETGVGLSRVKLVEPGWLIKSSSGKVSRRACREKFLQEAETGYE